MKKSANWHVKALKILRKANNPLSAYDVLGQLRKYNPQIAPTTVYRALAALTENGQIHRLESMNSYVACQREHHNQSPILSVCDDCGSVEESLAPQVLSALDELAGQSGFFATRQVIELRGQCVSCSGSTP